MTLGNWVIFSYGFLVGTLLAWMLAKWYIRRLEFDHAFDLDQLDNSLQYYRHLTQDLQNKLSVSKRSVNIK